MIVYNAEEISQENTDCELKWKSYLYVEPCKITEV